MLRTKYIINRELEARVAYKKSQIDYVYFDHPTLKNINFDIGSFCIYNYNYEYVDGQRIDRKTLKIFTTHIGTTTDNLLIFFRSNGINRENIDFDNKILSLSVKELCVHNNFEEHSTKLENVRVIIKLNRSGIARVRNRLKEYEK